MQIAVVSLGTVNFRQKADDMMGAPFPQHFFRIENMNVYFINKIYVGGIWIDARWYRFGAPFCELTNVDSFPRLIAYLEPVCVEIEGGQEIAFRKEHNVVKPSNPPAFDPKIFRVPGLIALADGDYIEISD